MIIFTACSIFYSASVIYYSNATLRFETRFFFKYTYNLLNEGIKSEAKRLYRPVW